MIGDFVLEFVFGDEEECGDFVCDGDVFVNMCVVKDLMVILNDVVVNVMDLKIDVEMIFEIFNEEMLLIFN